MHERGIDQVPQYYGVPGCPIERPLKDTWRAGSRRIYPPVRAPRGRHEEKGEAKLVILRIPEGALSGKQELDALLSYSWRYCRGRVVFSPCPVVLPPLGLCRVLEGIRPGWGTR
jgi:hypothetical protein